MHLPRSSPPQLDPSLWPAFEHLLHCFYHDALPPGLSVAQLLQVLRLADRFQAPTCLTACNQELQSKRAQDLSWPDLHAFYSTEASLQEGVLAGAALLFSSKLKGAFLAFEEAWRDDQLRGVFLDLPLPAVEELAALDELQVVSENTVATALAAWLQHSGGERQGAAAQLLQHLRLQHLTQAYIGDVLLQLSGLGSALQQQPSMLVAAMQYSQASPAARRRVQGLCDMKCSRPQPATSHALNFTWRPTLEQVAQLVQQRLQERRKGRLSSPVQRWNGFLLQLEIQAGTTKSKLPTLFVTLCVGADPAACSAPDAAGLRSAVVKGSVQLPGPASGSSNSFSLDMAASGTWQRTEFDVRKIKLGDGAAGDSATLVAALTHASGSVRAVEAPAPEARVRELRELPIRCIITQCT
jgi:hypothetical protein